MCYSEVQATEAPIKQIPFGYFRSYSYQPFITYPSPIHPQMMYSNYHNPFLHWAKELYPPQIAAHQSIYGAVPSVASSNRDAFSSPHSSIGLHKLFSSLKSASLRLDDNQDNLILSTTTRGSTTQKVQTTTSTTTAVPTTQSTTTTTEAPTTTAFPSTTVAQLRPNEELPTPAELYQKSPAIPAINRRSDVPLISRQPQQTFSNDPLTQRYLANYLAQNSANAQNIQFVPCMCPISVGMPQTSQFFQQPPDTMATKRRSDDLDVDSGNESPDNLDFEQPTTDQNFF